MSLKNTPDPLPEESGGMCFTNQNMAAAALFLPCLQERALVGRLAVNSWRFALLNEIYQNLERGEEGTAVKAINSSLWLCVYEWAVRQQ